MATIDTSTFSRRLRLARERKGLSQQGLADLSGISMRTVQNYENEAACPNPMASHLTAMMPHLDVGADWLLTGLPVGWFEGLVQAK